MTAGPVPVPDVSAPPEAPVEVTVAVYLTWDKVNRRWVVDPVTVDGAPLDHTENGIHSDAGPYSQLHVIDQMHWDDAEQAPLPTGVHLAHMILDAAGHHEVGDSYRRYLT